ncbi:MAG: flagellar hook-basal body complex protein FliE [Clostridiales bacterium]|nr:flagellar hook-basal body complex protein FliE [Eubacterium sp.]MDD5994016.1 flagellar hook-basal body complex protein FliE [Clostridiales bacterium]MDD7349039.1 flagellar hook-basal body complex protein FliE [Clostridiales bacterium]MDY3774975.1 flagellar hook-basal body complex protein FliE [Eubacterium sp.]
MDITNISAIQSLTDVSRYGSTTKVAQEGEENQFDTLLSSAMNMIGETNQLSNEAEAEEIRYATGQSDNMHDLMVAQQKANVSLQYTVAVKNTALEAYRSLMNMQM